MAANSPRWLLTCEALWTEARNSVLISIQGYDSFDFSNNSGTSDVAVDESVLDEKSFSVV